MPPKRKAAAKKGAGGKKAKKADAEPEAGTSEAPQTMSDAIQKLKAADKGKKRSCKPDATCPIGASSSVHLDYDCMLNQTNIGNNNNKFYIIQVLNYGGKSYTWNRWGRVGEPGQNAMKGPIGADAAIADFKKKFKDKTKNSWEDRGKFSPVPGKYTLLEMDDDEGEDPAKEEEISAKLDGLNEGLKMAPCGLDNQTQSLIKLIFDNNMFKEAMKDLDIDVKKMPLGKLSKTQIAKGFEVLEELEDALKQKKKGKALDELSSRFYTLVPHDFGRQRPLILATEEQIRKKMDMLMVLADIELAQAMQKTKTPSMTKDSKTQPHPLDVNYERLQADLEVLDKKGAEFKVLEKYLNQTKSHGWRDPKILDIWKVGRQKENARFLAHDKIENRKLLWHGTNVAVVAAILKSGLRIMPHSGGRVGKGIYFASENSKSAGYVSTSSGGIGIMFLNEVALGKEHHIKMDDWTLKTPPKGYDSIIAKGHTEPDPKQDTTLMIDNKKVTVPQGKAITQGKFSDSNFSQSEYLIYKESQNRIRYMLKLKM